MYYSSQCQFCAIHRVSSRQTLQKCPRMACGKKMKTESLTADMQLLLETGEGADLKLLTATCCLPAHRAVLIARSPIFAAMFYDEEESQKAFIYIEDVDEAVLRKLLHFIYTGEVPPLDGVAGDLLAAADKYQLLSLKASCEEWLSDSINIDDAAAIAVIAVTYDCTLLKKSAITYMKNHYLKIAGTKGWEEVMRNNVDASVEICKLMSTEADDECRTINLKRMLHDAARSGDTNKLQQLLQAGAEVEGRDLLHRRTALHWAAATGRSKAAECLLLAGAAVDATDRNLQMPLHLAAAQDDSVTVELLLNAGANPNSQDSTRATPLHYAAMFDSVATLRPLLEGGADPSIRGTGMYTAYGVACKFNSQQFIAAYERFKSLKHHGCHMNLHK